MNGDETLRIAVLSDLHAYDTRADGDQAPSYLCTNSPRDIPTQHPIKGLLDLIASKTLKADMLLCPGDFGDKARPAGIDCGWRAVHEIGKAIGAKHIVGTVGNHDVDSRFTQDDVDPIGFLQSLTPSFPLPDESLNDKFWSRKFAVLDETHIRLVLLNSSAFHGGKEGETRHGRVAERTIAALTGVLKNSTPKPVNILLCHHHPHKHSELHLGDYDEMVGGQQLLDLLGSGNHGEWMIVHGHKHHPKLHYAAGAQTAPIVFSAGSLCAKLYSELGTDARNQFYMISFPLNQFAALGMVGRFEAWDWAAGLGWRPAQRGSGLPSQGGFGYRGNLDVLASRVAEAISAAGSSFQYWDKMSASVPEVDYLLPGMLDLLLKRLTEKHGLNVNHDADGVPRQIGPRT